MIGAGSAGPGMFGAGHFGFPTGQFPAGSLAKSVSSGTDHEAAADEQQRKRRNGKQKGTDGGGSRRQHASAGISSAPGIDRQMQFGKNIVDKVKNLMQEFMGVSVRKDIQTGQWEQKNRRFLIVGGAKDRVFGR